MKKITLSLVAFMAFFGSMFTANAQCNDTLATFSSSTVQGWIKFEGVTYTYAAGKKYSTWFYLLNIQSGKSAGKDWSHSNFQLGSCMPSSMFDAGGTWTGTFAGPTLSTNSCWSIGKDGSDPYKMWGGKYDCGLGNGTHRIWIRLKSDYAATSNIIKVKAGTPFDSARICGPDTTCGPVPVMLIHLSATRVYLGESFYDSLSWITATELNNKEFQVQLSTDGEQWVDKGTVKTKAEGGNSSQLLRYNHKVQRPVPSAEQKVYYRLKQMDHDGTTAISWPVQSKIKPGSSLFGFQMYPNPGATINVVLEGVDVHEEKVLEVANSLGQTIFTRPFVGTATQIATDELAKMTPGTYSATITYRGFTKTQRLLIRK